MKNLEDNNNSNKGKDIVNILLEQLSSNSTARSIVEPPQIEGSTFNDWLYFFIQNAFIFFVWILSMVWVCYVIFYNSRLLGFIITKIVNYLFIKNGYFKIGSFSFAAISGKIMFRDVIYIDDDYSIRIQDGWMVFCYWIPYEYRDARTEDLSNSDVRLLIYLDGLEIHIYNQTKRYSELEKLFNLPTKFFCDEQEKEIFVDKDKHEKETREKILKSMNQTKNELKQSIWRDLIPMIKIEISSGRFIFGNYLMPSTLSISFEDSQFHYTSQPAASQYDLLTHILKGKAENLQVMLIPSEKYCGAINDEPPRIMGDGFNVFRTNKIEIYYYQDVPGFVTEEAVNETNNPVWGIVIKCGKGTDFSYGPWADRQRGYLYSFFFPANYQLIPVDEKPKIGERRRFESFDIRLSTLHEAKIDILFSKNKETHALHINAMPGSYLEATIPWVCNNNGYSTHILGQILHLDATTSLQFRPLIQSETFEFDVDVFFPRLWNGHQEWLCKITACKATVNLIFAHKIFIQDLIDDWCDKDRPDIYKFIPYTWKISIVIKDFELLVLANQFNWIDCSTSLNDENCKIAICGEHFDLAFDLPFVEFLPPKLMIKIWIQGECLEGAFYVPEIGTNRDIIELIQRFSNINDRNESFYEYLAYFGHRRKWKSVVSQSNHWYDCMNAPIVALSITYDYWPMPVIDDNLKRPAEYNASIPLRKGNIKFQDEIQDFEVSSLLPDIMTIELEMGPSNIALFGVLFRFLWNIKENYLGESQVFNEMSPNFFDDKKRTDTQIDSRKDKSIVELEMEPRKTFDPRIYRPFEVIVSVTLHEIHGHLVQCLSDSKHYSPLIYVEKLCFELRKTFLETKLQLIISPAIVQIKDRIKKIDFPESLEEGFLTLSSLQFRGHAVFSNLNRPLQSETLEYGWLVDVEVGEIGGRLTVDQFMQIVMPMETFLLQIFQMDLDLQSPNPFYKCLHDRLQNECPESNLIANRLCPYPEDLKYRLVRVNFDKIDLFFIESNVIINILNESIKLATCNLHINKKIDGLTLLISDLILRQFVPLSPMKNMSRIHEWAEIGFVSTGPILLDLAMKSSKIDDYTCSQRDFLLKHDAKTKRLWFLWNDLNKCGCIGNCAFFGCNFDGQTFFKQKQIPQLQSTSLKTITKCLGQKLHDHSKLIHLNYGESLLHPENYLLDLHSPLIDETNKAIMNTGKSSQSGRSMIEPQKTQHSSQLKTKWSGISNDRFFSAEDLASGSTTLSSRMERLISNNDKSLSSSSPNWQSPAETLLSPTQYMTARDHLSSFDLSAGTSQQKLSSLSSDSPTIVSPKNIEINVSDSTTSTKLNENEETRSIYSFMSALSDNQIYDMVDLRNQLQKPIIDSPLLMSAYSAYLSLYSSEYLDIPSPIQNIKICNYFHMKSPQALHFERLIFEYRNNWKPKFMLKNAGFSETKFTHCNNDNTKSYDLLSIQPGIVGKKFDLNHINDRQSFLSDKDVLFSAKKPSMSPSTEPFSRSRTATLSTKNEEDACSNKHRSETIITSTSNMSTSCNIDCDYNEVIEHCFMHLQMNEIQIKISLLTFDVMSSMLKTMTEIFDKLHPINLLNHCSYSIMNQIEKKNVLKKNCQNYIGQLHMRAWKIMSHRQSMKHLNRSISFATDRNVNKMVQTNENTNLAPNILLAKNLEYDYRKLFNMSIDIGRVNISTIQSSIVEEFISFSSLDNVKDITCVLVWNISLNELNFKFHHQTRQKHNLHVFMEQTATNTEKALMIRFFTRKPKKVFAEIDINAFETIDAYVHENKINFSLKNIQSQLSRLINSPKIIDEIILSVIPCSKSKINFIFTPPSFSMEKNNADNADELSSKYQHFNSFVMFEFGMDDMSFITNKSSYYNAIKIENNDPNLEELEYPTKPLTNCELQGMIANIWFHFASSSSKKSSIHNDYDRYDWHLLSSLIPLIIAWVSVYDRLKDDYDQMKNQLKFRNCSSLACLLSNGRQNFSHNQKLKTNNSSKQMIRIFSALAKTLQDDPSFILMNVLRSNFKESFKSIAEFEAYFQRRSIIPNNKDLEKCLVLLLFHWKEVLNVPVSNFGQIFFHHHSHPQQQTTNSPKMTFSSTKNQILTLLEAKFNLMMNNTAHENGFKNVTLPSSSTPEPLYARKHNIDNEESIQINMVNDMDTSETTKLIHNKSQQLPQQLIVMNHDDIELQQTEISSQMTRNTVPEYLEIMAKHRQNILSSKHRSNRVHFSRLDANRLRTLYDRFLATPIIRNITAFCSFCSFKKFHFHHNRDNNDNDNSFELDSIPIDKTTNNQQLQKLPQDQRMQQKHEPKSILNQSSLPNIENDRNDVGINIDELFDEGFNTINNEQNNDNTFSDQKDLYWWMVKQQDYMKNSNRKIKSNNTITFKSTNTNDDDSIINQTAVLTDNDVNEISDNDIVAVDQLKTSNVPYTAPIKETTFDEKKSAKETIRKYGLNCEATQYFENFSKIFGLSDVLDFDKLSEQEHDGFFGSNLSLIFNIKEFGIQIEESEQNIQKNMFTNEMIASILKRIESLNNQRISTELSFVFENLNFNALVQKLNHTQVNELISNDFNDLLRTNPILNRIPNFSPTTKNLFTSITDKKSNENEFGFDTMNFLVFNCHIEQITQRINLPLLRFIHQISAIYDDILQIRLEMQSNRNIFTDDNNDGIDDDNDDDKDSISLNSTTTTTTTQTSATTTSDSDTIKSEKNDTIDDGQPMLSMDQLKDQLPMQQDEKEEEINNFEQINYSNIDNCWLTISKMLEQYQQTKSKLFTNQAEHFGQFNEDDFYSVYSSLINKPLIIISNMTVKRMNVIAMLSGLKLESELSNFDSLITHYECRKKCESHTEWPNILTLKSLINSTIDINLERTSMSLFESLSFDSVNSKRSQQQLQQQLVVKLWIEKSNLNLGRKNESDLETNFDIENLDKINDLLKSSNFKTNLDSNHARIMIGNIEIDIPQHPVALHGMMTRSGKQLSTTLQELRYSRQLSRSSRPQQQQVSTSNDTNDSQRLPSSPLMSASPHMSFDGSSSIYHNKKHSIPGRIVDQSKNQRITTPLRRSTIQEIQMRPISYHHQHHMKMMHRANQQQRKSNLISPLIVDFEFILESVAIKASLLPSLQAKYLIGQVKSTGCTGSKAKFIVDINDHSLCLKTIMESYPSEANASINLPRIHIDAEYKKDLDRSKNAATELVNRTESFSTDGIVFRKGSYLNMIAEISSFEHSLTTDLLNHLLFVQKVFMKEINEVLQKVSRNENEHDDVVNRMNGNEPFIATESSSTSTSRILFSLSLKMTGIQITATTPTNNAVRFETGVIDLRVSNRLMNAADRDRNFKIFVRVQLDFIVALGQLIRNQIFEEAEPDFQQLAYFKTKICMRNASQNQPTNHLTLDLENDDDKEVVLITLNRPLVYVQPLALDKAILVWINYKNAYEYWNEQRASLNNEILQASQPFFDKMHPFTQSFSSSQSSTTLLLQLTVDDFGICLPISTTSTLSKFSTQSRIYDSDIKDALVLTLESTRISALSRGSLVSKGEFKNLCIRFADDFETMLDDWKPDLSDPSIQNLCMVSEGTYQICSRTMTNKKNNQMDHAHSPTTAAIKTAPILNDSSNYLAEAKWILNVHWKMDGFDIHVDTSIGKQISALFKTMTAIAGDEDDEDDDDEYDNNEESLDTVDTTKNEKMMSSEEKSVRNISTPLVSSAALLQTSLTSDALNLNASSTHRAKELMRKRNIEKEFNEQAKIINDLRQLGASDQTIRQEMERFRKLEAAVFNNFRRDVIKKLKRPSNSSSTNKQNQSTKTESDMNKNHVYSQSIHSYDEFNKFSNDQLNSGKNPLKIDEECSMTSRSSSISIPNDLNYDIDDVVITDDRSLDNVPLSTSLLDSTILNIDKLNKGKPSNNKINESNNNDYNNKLTNFQTQAPTSSTMIEPKIDFELNVKIFFNSGKCVLHTKEQRNDIIGDNNRNYSATEMTDANNFNNTDNRSPTNGNINNQSSNINRSRERINKSRSYNKLMKGQSYLNRRDYTQSVGMNPDFTVFLIPGLDIKLNYCSKNVNANDDSHEKERPVQSFRNLKLSPSMLSPPLNDHPSAETNISRTSVKSTKKAILFAWITLNSIPEEIFISPHILDFFEEALKPIPLNMSGQNSANATLSSLQSQKFAAHINNDNNNKESTSSGGAGAGSPYVYYSSFPVDVIVFFHFQPTIIRLGCLPISRVECLLHLPSIDLVMSSNRSDIDPSAINDLNYESTFQQFSNKTFKNIKMLSNVESQPNNNSGGLNITGCLADFSLYIFHPYGGQKNKATNTTASGATNYSANERKDSLSLQVEFVKMNISRSRKLSLNDCLTQSISFSAICDIGTATFKYDVKRLNEILAFPKAWYRKSIWKKIFIGENTLNAIFSEEDDDDNSNGNDYKEEIERNLKFFNDSETYSSDDSSSISSTTSLSNEISLESCSHIASKRKNRPKKKKSKSHLIAVVNNPWETLILFTINFSKLNVSMNMGNIMGNVNWQTKELMCDGSISIDSNEHRKFRIGLCLNNSTLDAKGGIVGGIVELSDIRSEINIREDKNLEPQHRLYFSLHTIENRIDYMGTSILMARISDLSASFSDKWNSKIDYLSTNVSNMIEPSIHIQATLKWDQMQILMSKSTSPDFMKIILKLEEFISQQFHSGKRVFDSLHPTAKSTATTAIATHEKNKIQKKSIESPNLKPLNEKSSSEIVSLQPLFKPFHRYWRKALQLLSDRNSKLGGSIEVQAQNISLVCFHGVNFRSKSWAIFCLKEPSITFDTEAELSNSDSASVIQKLELILGRNDEKDGRDPTETMAIVSKITRTVAFPPQFRHFHEWFHYALSPVVLNDVNRFPLPTCDNCEFDAFGVPIESLTPSQQKTMQSDRRSKLTSEFHHKEEMIFAFPSMKFELTTKQKLPIINPIKPTDTSKVLCSFRSDFIDHIYVAVDAEAYFFLHNLISSYISETSANIPMSSDNFATTGASTTNKSDKDVDKKDAKKINDKKGEAAKNNEKQQPKNSGKKSNENTATNAAPVATGALIHDYREFECEIWQLEPTVRLHSWASKNIDPYGVDYILQRLGFSQARTTIPKWIQRSTMDVADKIISIIVYQMLKKDKKENSKPITSEGPTTITAILAPEPSNDKNDSK